MIQSLRTNNIPLYSVGLWKELPEVTHPLLWQATSNLAQRNQPEQVDLGLNHLLVMDKWIEVVLLAEIADIIALFNGD